MLVWIGIAANSIDYGYYSNKINVDIWGNNFIIFLTVLMSTLGLYLFLSLVRHIKNKTILSHSLVGKIVGAVFGFLKEVHESSSTSKKVGLALALYPMVVAATFVIFPITIGVVIFFAIKKVKEFEAIKEGVKKIKNGDLDYQIQIDKRGEFKNLAEDINEISGGLKKAVDNELKSERHRSELITNVSHDIRTPLTSIITYVDLLKHEEDQEEKEKYIEVLESKSKRLKQLIDNLFEASKYSSGDVPVESSKIDIVSLLNQGLGELNDEIENKKLDFITSFESEEMLVIADGELLWRAIENLLSNILKYALKGSRVYIDIFQEENHVLLIMKNISAYELNISEEELMRRFARGDDSRNSDGSGLGLSIATSLIELQKGEFKIDIDGDLFKTSIKLPKY